MTKLNTIRRLSVRGLQGTPNRHPLSPLIRLPSSGSLARGRFQVLRHCWRGMASARFQAMDFHSGGVPVEVLWLPGQQRCDTHLSAMRELYRLESPVMPELQTLMRGESACAAVFEILSGDPLAPRLGRGPLRQHRALVVTRAVLGALARCHEVGVDDNDISPGAIRLLPDGGVRWLGAGLGWLLREEARCRGASSSLHAYIAPTALAPVQRDLYAVSMLLYAMLCGRLPPSSRRGPRRLPASSDVDPRLGAVMMSAARGGYPSAAAMSAALQALQPPPPVFRAAKSPPR